MAKFFKYADNASRARVPYQLAGEYDHANTRTDIYSVGGYPDQVAFSDLYNAWRRRPLATAIINLPVRMCWQTPPTIKCDDQVFMSALDNLIENFSLWERLRGLDVRQRIGQYGGIMLVARESGNARPESPLKVRSPSAMVKLMPLLESQLEVTDFVTEFSSPDYGMPKYFNFKDGVVGTRSIGANASATLHPSRVFIFAEGADDGNIFGIPAIESCFNSVMDAEKIRCGGSEGLFRNSKQRFTIEVSDLQVANGLRNPEIKKEFEENVDDFNKGFDNSLLLAGSKANNLQSTLSDPMPYWMICVNEIAAATGIPATIIIGMMTGRLASDEDQKQLAKYVMERRNNTLNPMLRRFFAHMADVGLLPRAKAKIEIEWDNLLESTESEKADLALKMAQTNKVGVDSGMGPYFKPEWIIEAGGYDAEEEMEGGDLLPENAPEIYR